MNLNYEKPKNILIKLVSPIIFLFEKMNLSPNSVTILGFIISIFSGVAFAFGHFFWGGILILISGIFDIMDGYLAKKNNKVTEFGALLDSSLDRYAEFISLSGLGTYYILQGYLYSTIILAIAIIGSIMVSYVRARSEGLGYNCKVGILERLERIVLLGFLSLFGFYGSVIAISIIAVLANVTVVERLHHIGKLTNLKYK